MTGYAKVKDAFENIGLMAAERERERESESSKCFSLCLFAAQRVQRGNFTSVLINGVDPLHVSRHHLDARLLRAVSREKLMVRLQVEHAGRLPRVHGGTFVQMPGDTIGVAGSGKRKGGKKKKKKT